MKDTKAIRVGFFMCVLSAVAMSGVIASVVYLCVK